MNGEVTLNLEKGCTFLFFISTCLLFILLHSKLGIVISLVNKEGEKKEHPVFCEILVFQIKTDSNCV